MKIHLQMHIQGGNIHVIRVVSLTILPQWSFRERRQKTAVPVIFVTSLYFTWRTQSPSFAMLTNETQSCVSPESPGVEELPEIQGAFSSSTIAT